MLPVRGTHVLVAGATGSGKGSVLWSVVRGLGPWVRAGLVELWVADPKGGMKLAPGAAMFTRFAVNSGEIAGMLDDAVSLMQDRTDRLRGVTRLHTPTVGEPLVVVVVDEIAALTAYVTDRDLKRRLSASLPLPLSQGRAPGVVARSVTIPDAIICVVADHMARHAEPGPDGLVFTTRDGRPVSRHNRSWWRRACRIVGVDERAHLHDCRHAGLTLAAQSGATLRELMALGDSTPRAAMIYQRATQDRAAEVAGAVSARLARLGPRPPDDPDNPDEDEGVRDPAGTQRARKPETRSKRPQRRLFTGR
jgi:hypothetical protein